MGIEKRGFGQTAGGKPVDLYTLTNTAGMEVKITNYAYFNMAGAGSGHILNHELMICADRVTPVDSCLIPTSELRSVKSTPFDFNRPITIGARINHDDEQLVFGKGYDHNWVLNREVAGPCLASRAYKRLSDRRLEVYTTQPGLQFYSGNFLVNRIDAKAGQTYRHRDGFCLET